MTARIDAHQHFWHLARGDYGWLTPELAPIFRDFTPEDLVPILARNGIDATILVQAAPTEAETEFLLDIGARIPFIAGVVGWADFEAPDRIARVERLAANRLLVGLRPMLHDIDDDDWISRSELEPALAEMALQGLVFDALVRPRHLSRLPAVVDRHPDLTFVLDHIGKPDIATGGFESWSDEIVRLAERDNMVCKLSGLVTEARSDWHIDDLKPYVMHILSCFGPHRIIWGSDWPVVDLAGGYDRWFEATGALIAGQPDPIRSAILGGTAARIYLSNRGRKPC